MLTSRAMRDSTLGWLGLIPEAWELKPFFTVCSELNNKNKGMKESNLLSLSYGNIVLKDIDSNEGLLPESFEGYQIVMPDDLVFRFTDLQNDQRSLRSAISEYNGIITSAYLAVRPHDAIPKYLAFLMRAYDQLKVFYSMGGGLRQAMNFQDVKRLPIPVPPLAEQQAIVEFLDRETAQIDALIEKQNQLVETLNARRNAVIVRAVTRGHKNNPELRATGLEWLPQIPGDWTQKPFFTVGREIKNKNKDLQETNLLSLSYGEIVNRDIDSKDGLLPESFDGYQIIQPLDLVFRFTDLQNDQKSLRSAISGSKGIITSAYLAVRLTSQNPDFIAFLMRGYDLLKVFYAMGGGLRQSMKFDDIRRLPIFLPGLEEQETIVEFLTKTTTEIDRLKTKALDMVQLLQERRQALISAAVTGKIDVRGK